MLFAILAAAIALFPMKALAASDLVITMQGPGTANRGQTVQYTVTVANNGPDSAPQVRLQGSVPYDFLLEPASSDGRCNAPYGSLACDLGLLPAGTVTNLTFAFTVRPLAVASSCYPLTADVSVSLSFGGTDFLWNNNSATVRTAVPCPPPVECNDGIDNDRDGATDYSAYSWGNGDFGCSSSTDRDERYPEAVCQDGRDNDADGLIDFPWDPGCTGRQDNDEFNPPPPPPSLPSTFPPQSPPQLQASLVPQGTMPWLALPIPRCYNNVGAGWVEDIMIDIRCDGSKWGQGTSGGGGSPRILACRDGKDNDGDGKVDFPADTGCWGRSDASEEDAGGRGGGSDGSGGGGGTGWSGGGTGNGGDTGGGSGGNGGGSSDEGEPCTGKGQAIVERTVHQQEVFPGAALRYTITVRNASSRCPLMNLVLRNRLPPGTIVLDAGSGIFDGHDLRWHIPRIDPGATRRISYSVRVPRSFSGDRFGGALSIDGADGRISDGDPARVLRRFPKTGVDASAMKAAFWVVLVSGSLGGGWYWARRAVSL